ncbi:MAG: 4-(cytidine 5'-diphospho)-2-C-methyl-D-erythritol kinase [Rhodobacteraceae bacterium]|nr:4-(cytidine 5'-diphospho)-2-C-methyl-D-erythritol kinase [Paracoccaceae bacterium]
MTIRLAGFAPAKINLFLHVTGKRADGYHLLDSLVAFVDIGDRLIATDAPDFSLDITGPYAAMLDAGPENLVLKAARFVARHAGTKNGAAFVLEKNLPVASGIGGGSSDAATAMLLVRKLWNVSASFDDTVLAAELGADVPVCLKRRPMRMNGIGETLQFYDGLPQTFIILANPGVPLSTKDVFQRFRMTRSSVREEIPVSFSTAEQLVQFLTTTQNDLAGPAVEAVPAIGDVVTALREIPGCLTARLSGSGPTCFGLFATAEAAFSGAAELSAKQPNWWVQAGQLGTFPDTNP